MLLGPVQVEEGLCQLMAMLWLDSQDWWAKSHGQYQETLLSYLGYQIRTDTSEVSLHRHQWRVLAASRREAPGLPYD